jgi:hypothetical protein
VYIDVYLAGGISVDRDEVEEELAQLEGFEIVGAGVGQDGTNVDLEVLPSIPRDEALRQVAGVLSRLGVTSGAHLRPSDTGESIDPSDLVS